jgi:hypothetical protein
MGGLTEELPPDLASINNAQRAHASRLGVEEDDWRDLIDGAIDRYIPEGRAGSASHQLGPTIRDLERHVGGGGGELSPERRDAAYRMFEVVARQHMGGGANYSEAAARALSDVMPYLTRAADAGGDYVMAKQGIRNVPTPRVAKRYIMSDEMRRRLILEGVGASIGAGIMSQDDLIERLNQ